jgi:hypothetical protein
MAVRKGFSSIMPVKEDRTCVIWRVEAGRRTLFGSYPSADSAGEAVRRCLPHLVSGVTLEAAPLGQAPGGAAE